MFRPGDEPVPSYRLEEILGRGGSGEVWRATAPGETSVALKLIGLSGSHGPKEFRAVWRFKEIRHAHLVPITALWLLDRDGNVLDATVSHALDGEGSTSESVSRETEPQASSRPATLVMAMLLGDKDLADLLQECRWAGTSGIPVDELLDYLKDAAGGIDFLNSPRHDLGAGPAAVQHGDIKPQNIMLVGDSAAVCDFGLARVLGEGGMTGAVAGSPAYMSPEVIEGRPPTSTSDQYSLAITYLECRTGSLPFAEGPYMAILDAHLQGRLDLSQLPPAEREVIRRATALDPDKRYPTAGEMVEALRQAVESQRERETGRPLPDSTAAASSPTRSAAVSSTEIAAGRPRAEQPQFELRGKIGRNAYGTVYRGWDPKMKREVAIMELHKKFLRDPEQARACWNQVTDLAALSHDHIVRVFTGEEAAGRIVMEVMQGNLAESLEAGPLPAELVREVLRQALWALHFLHAHDRLHGDVRPATLLLNSEGQIKLSFSVGIALCGEIPWELRSQKYVAPELLDAEFGRPGPQTDLYCLGFSALELLVGPQFDACFLRAGESPEDTWADWHGSPSRRLPATKQLVPDVPDDLARVIDRLLEKHHRQRYGSAQEARKDLARQPEEAAEAARPEGRLPASTTQSAAAKRRPSTARRYVACLVILVLLGTAAGIAALVGWWPSFAPRRPVDPARRDPVAALARCDRGIEHLEAGEPARAIACFDEAIRLDPRCARALNNRGLAHSRQDRLDEAIADYTEAIRLEPKEPTPYINRGIARQLQDKLAEAITDYSTAIRLDPARPAVYRLRSRAYRKSGQPEKARADEARLAELAVPGE